MSGVGDIVVNDTPQQAEILYSGGHVRLARRGDWEYVERIATDTAAVIVAVTEDRHLLLVEQFRPPMNSAVIELPAGLVGDHEAGDNESLLDAAGRELLEETGYSAGQMRQLTAGPPEPGLVNQHVVFVLARQLSRENGGGGVGSEQITVHHVPLDEVESWLDEKRQAGVLVDPKVYIGLYFLMAG